MMLLDFCQTMGYVTHRSKKEGKSRTNKLIIFFSNLSVMVQRNNIERWKDDKRYTKMMTKR